MLVLSPSNVCYSVFRAGFLGRAWRLGRIAMRRTLAGFAALAAAIFGIAPVHAQQTIKIGLILPFSGQFADPGAQADNGIKLYMQQHGDTVAGKKIEVIRKDTGGIAPDVAKRLAQELVVRDKVD